MHGFGVDVALENAEGPDSMSRNAIVENEVA
jgi:hypothetical protein